MLNPRYGKSYNLLVAKFRIQLMNLKTKQSRKICHGRIIKDPDVMDMLSTALIDVKASLGMEDKIIKIIKVTRNTNSGCRQETLDER